MIKSMYKTGDIEGLPTREITDFLELMRDDKTKVFVNHEHDILAFRIMTKNANNGGYGCQIEDLLKVVLNQLENFNNIFKCSFNYETAKHLKAAIEAQQKRTQDRINRGVEGQNKL
jgi:hypothetical protein